MSEKFTWRQEIWGKRIMPGIFDTTPVTVRGPLAWSDHGGEEFHISVSYEGQYIGAVGGITDKNGAVHFWATDVNYKQTPIFEKAGK